MADEEGLWNRSLDSNPGMYDISIAKAKKNRPGDFPGRNKTKVSQALRPSHPDSQLDILVADGSVRYRLRRAMLHNSYRLPITIPSDRKKVTAFASFTLRHRACPGGFEKKI